MQFHLHMMLKLLSLHLVRNTKSLQGSYLLLPPHFLLAHLLLHHLKLLLVLNS